MTHEHNSAAVLIGLFLCTSAAGNPLQNITIKTQDGTVVAIQTDELSGARARPLRKLKERWDRKFKREFLYFRKIEVKAGQEIVGRYQIEGPLRLSIYRISKKEAEPRILRILSTRFHEEGSVAEVRARVEISEEDVFFITAENVQSAHHLNQHLEYMAFRDGELEVSGFSTNWNLSELKFKMIGKEKPARDDGFVKDADWLIGQLIDPQWIVSIRVETK